MAKVLISMRDEFLEQVDEIAETEQRTRSELIRQALREYITTRRGRGASNRSKQTADAIESILLG